MADTETDEARLVEFLGPRWWPNWLGLLVMRLLAFLPLPVITFIGALFGEFLYLVHAERRHITRTNLQRCFPELSSAELRKLARAHFRSVAASFLTVPIVWWGSAARLERLVRRRGEEHLKTALATKRPVILLSAHFNAIEVGGVSLSRDYPVLDMYKRPKNRLFHYLLRRRRRRFGGYLVERQEGIKPVIRAIRKGVLFLYLTDQDQGREGSVFAPFFGIQTSTVTGLSRVAAITDALVVPCFMRVLPWGQGYEVIFQPALENFPTTDELADTTRMNRIIEEAVREMPEQYFWVHKRFKTRPEGEAPFY
ncbi:MAG: lysophospholipid acyltransferase family protein [Gammaproteobacteria bacterium]|nr:lysophospholipid acyltransferase family protein [Gammaproteobacteria bacterium]